MTERIALEQAIKREPDDKGARCALVDWLIEHDEYSWLFAAKVATRIAKTARDEREVKACHRVLTEGNVFKKSMGQLIAQATSMAYGDALIIQVVPGCRKPVAKREAVGLPFLDQAVHRVKVGAKWMLAEVLATIRFHSLLPLLEDPEELMNWVNEYGKRGEPDLLYVA